MKKLDLLTRDAGGVKVVDISGFVDRHTLDKLDKELEKIIQEGCNNIVINCNDLAYISSNGMGVFIAYLQKVREKGGDIRFCNMKDIGKTVITVLGLHNLFKIFDTEEEAVQSFQSS
ncbi:MAG: anti-sigma factor antagonist [Planctomycetota bacterium]|nr:MAG: anti-sigma factor antagonist [Planctomycetota bacterium]